VWGGRGIRRKGLKAWPCGKGGEVLVLNVAGEVTRLRVFKSMGGPQVSLIITVYTRVGFHLLEEEGGVVGNECKNQRPNG
jgi:hypothetical protein